MLSLESTRAKIGVALIIVALAIYFLAPYAISNAVSSTAQEHSLGDNGKVKVQFFIEFLTNDGIYRYYPDTGAFAKVSDEETLAWVSPGTINKLSLAQARIGLDLAFSDLAYLTDDTFSGSAHPKFGVSANVELVAPSGAPSPAVAGNKYTTSLSTTLTDTSHVGTDAGYSFNPDPVYTDWFNLNDVYSAITNNAPLPSASSWQCALDLTIKNIAITYYDLIDQTSKSTTLPDYTKSSALTLDWKKASLSASVEGSSTQYQSVADFVGFMSSYSTQVALFIGVVGVALLLLDRNVRER